MEQQNQEYCHYILLHNSDNPNMNMDFDDTSLNIKEKYLDFIDEFIAEFKTKFKIKDEDFRSDKMLIDILSYFIHSRILFFGQKREDRLDKLYKRTKELLQIEKKHLKENVPVSLDSVWEILYNSNILLMNSMISSDNKDKIATYHTTEIDIPKILAMVNEIKKIDRKILKHQKMLSVDEEIDNVIPAVLQIALYFLPYVKYAMFTKSIIYAHSNAQLKKAKKEELKFMYFSFLLTCTQVHYNELKERYGYGW